MAKIKSVRTKQTVSTKSSLRAAIPCAFLILAATALMGLLFYAMLKNHK